MIFNDVRQIFQDIQHTLCPVTQPQGTIADKDTYAELLLVLYQSSLASEHGIHCMPTVTYSQPKSVSS